MVDVVEHLVPGIRRPRPDPDGRPPSEHELETLLRAAASVPDHGLLRPWRFIVISGEARQKFGDALAADVAETGGAEPLIERARQRAFGAPAHIALIVSPRESRIPEWEQEISAGCCGYAIILAATGLGLGAAWKSVDDRGGPALRALFGADEHESILGWIGVGSPRADIGRGDRLAEIAVTVL